MNERELGGTNDNRNDNTPTNHLKNSLNQFKGSYRTLPEYQRQ